jgi:hypothetical protein
MKAVILSFFLACLLCLPTLPACASGSVHVRGSVTRRGVYRQPHRRTAPNHTQHDNWSTKGNRNPYTGKAGSKRAKR